MEFGLCRFVTAFNFIHPMPWSSSSSLRHAGCGLPLSQLARYLLRVAGWLGMAMFERAESPSWNARYWHTEHDLPDPCVTAIAQPRDGYLWLGTPKGLLHFDGMQFRLFDLGAARSARCWWTG
jgi:hypothetical protein